MRANKAEADSICNGSLSLSLIVPSALLFLLPLLSCHEVLTKGSMYMTIHKAKVQQVHFDSETCNRKAQVRQVHNLSCHELLFSVSLARHRFDRFLHLNFCGHVHGPCHDTNTEAKVSQVKPGMNHNTSARAALITLRITQQVVQRHQVFSCIIRHDSGKPATMHFPRRGLKGATDAGKPAQLRMKSQESQFVKSGSTKD